MRIVRKCKKCILKGIKSGCAVLALTICFGTSALAEDAKEWTIGYEENKNGPEEEKQGTNGWYFLYSSEMNTDGALDASKLKECIWSNSGSCWMYYGYTGLWMPEKYTKKGYDCGEQKNWWRMDGNGIMDPSAGNDSFRSVIAWEAPKDGKYSVEMEYTAGSDSYEWEGKTYYNEDADGLTLSLNTEKEVLEKAFCEAVTEKKPELGTGKLSSEVELKKGEKLYVSADPGKNGSGDSVQIKMSIKQAGTGKKKSSGEKADAGEEQASDTKADANEDAGAGTVSVSTLVLPLIAVMGVLIGIVYVLIRGRRE